jgi:hypothetical protein
LEGIKEDYKPYVIGIPAGGAGLVLLSLVIGLIARRFGFVSLFLVYLSALLSAGLLFQALFTFREEAKTFRNIQGRVEKMHEKGATGEVAAPIGPFFFAGFGGAVGASVFLTLAGVLMHRRWWSRSLGFLFLGGVNALAAVWIYRETLGIGLDSPFLPF